MNDTIKDEKISCGYFTGKAVPAGCRGTLSQTLNLATALHEKHYADVTHWKPLAGDLSGLILQIDNMTAGLVRAPTLKAENETLREQWDALLEFFESAVGEEMQGEASGALGVALLHVPWRDIRRARAAIAKAEAPS